MSYLIWDIFQFIPTLIIFYETCVHSSNFPLKFNQCPTIPHLNIKRVSKNTVKDISIRLLINKGVSYNLNLCIAEAILIQQELLTSLNTISDLESAHIPFPKVFCKSLCVYGPAHLSQFKRILQEFRLKIPQELPQFQIHIVESIKGTPVAMYPTQHRVQISLRVSIISSFFRCRIMLPYSYHSMFSHFMTCYYPLNLHLGISNHLGQITITQ